MYWNCKEKIDVDKVPRVETVTRAADLSGKTNRDPVMSVNTLLTHVCHLCHNMITAPSRANTGLAKFMQTWTETDSGKPGQLDRPSCLGSISQPLRCTHSYKAIASIQ